MPPMPVTSLPARLSFVHGKPGEFCFGRGEAGYTVVTFADAKEAAAFFLAHRASEMPCWQRMEVIDGMLMLVR